MENNWERSLPFLNIDINIANELVKDIFGNVSVKSIDPIKEGCRTSNYIIKVGENNKKYILKIFPEKNINYQKENNILDLLKTNILVQNIYCISKNKIINDRAFGIYEYMEGKTLGQAVKLGYVIEKNLVKDLAKTLAKIHKIKFDTLGEIDDKLNVINKLPPLYTWYEKFMGVNFKRRLGDDVINKIKHIVNINKQNLIDLDKDISLVHGDFQGTNILINQKKLSGIIDWEFSMAGHALADIGQLFRYEEYFNQDLIDEFEEEYNKYSKNKLIKDWYKIAKLRDLINLIQLISHEEEMPNKYKEIKKIIVNILDRFE